jgi:ribosomal protein L13
MNMGTYVVVINAEQILVSGKKFEDKLYRRHPTGRPGSMKIESFKALQARIPERIVEKAVRGMLPKNRMGRELFTQLKVRWGTAHRQPLACNPQPTTHNPQPSTLTRQTTTRNPRPSTHNPQPSTINYQPPNLKPQPSTINHRSSNRKTENP